MEETEKKVIKDTERKRRKGSLRERKISYFRKNAG